MQKIDLLHAGRVQSSAKQNFQMNYSNWLVSITQKSTDVSSAKPKALLEEHATVEYVLDKLFWGHFNFTNALAGVNTFISNNLPWLTIWSQQFSFF